MNAEQINLKIKEIEDEMARTQKNKATNAHMGLLKAKIAKLKRQLVVSDAFSLPPTQPGAQGRRLHRARFRRNSPAGATLPLLSRHPFRCETTLDTH